MSGWGPSSSSTAALPPRRRVGSAPLLPGATGALSSSYPPQAEYDAGLLRKLLKRRSSGANLMQASRGWRMAALQRCAANQRALGAHSLPPLREWRSRNPRCCGVCPSLLTVPTGAAAEQRPAAQEP